MNRSNATKRALLVACLLGGVAFVGYALFRIQHDPWRVAPQDEAAVSLLTKRGGSLAKSGRDRRVVSLNLSDTGVTDDDLRVVATLSELRRLDLTHTRISDAGLRHLAPLKKLEYIDVSHTRVTDNGVQILGSQHPRLKMIGRAGIPLP